MPGTPILVEAEETLHSRELQLCWKIAVRLARNSIAPLVASTTDKFEEAIAKAHAAGAPPAIFVINTFGAKTMLPFIDPLIGELPVLYFRRSLYAGQSGLMSSVPEMNFSPNTTTAVLRKMTPRLTSIWYYGSKNADAVAERASRTLTEFLKDGDFRHIEVQNKLEELEYRQ